MGRLDVVEEARDQGLGRPVAVRVRVDVDRVVALAQALGGLLEPADMVPLYLFLASSGAKDITGQAYMLDRGEVMA